MIITLAEQKGTGHCDGKVFQQTLADTLVWMWRGYEGE
jgi:hypothetical protein